MSSPELAGAIGRFISGEDRSIRLANEIEVGLDALGCDESPFVEAVDLLSRYRPEGGPFMATSADVVKSLAWILESAGVAPSLK